MAELGRLIAEGDFPHSMEYYSNWFALVGTGYVVEGEGNECEPTIAGTENRTVQVDTGEICLGYGNRRARDAVDSVVLDPNDSDYDRYDVIYLQDDGSGGWEIFSDLGTIQGTPSDEPKHPDIPMPSEQKIVPICVVYWEGHSDEITSIKDCRTVMHDWMEDAAGTLHRWERTGLNSSLPDTGIALRSKVNPSAGEPILSVLNAEGSPRLLVGEDGFLGTSNPEIRTGIQEDGTGGNVVCDEGNLGNGLAFGSGHFKADLGNGLLFNSGGGISVDLEGLAGDGLRKSFNSLKVYPQDFAGSGLGVYGSDLFIKLADLSGLDILNDKLLINVGNGLIINSENELELADRSFLDLIDTPSEYTDNAGKLLKVMENETGLDYTTIELITDFLGLSDTPSDYTGDGGKSLRVADTEDGIEFVEGTNEPIAKRLFEDGSFYYRFNFDESWSSDADSNTYQALGTGTFELDSYNGFVKLSNIDFAKSYSKDKELGKSVLSWNKHQAFRTVIEMSDVTNGDFRVVRGRPHASTPTPRGFGFKITGGKIYGICGGLGNGEVEMELCSASDGTRIELKAELFPGDHIDFYVNGVLEGIATNGLPCDDFVVHRLFYFKELDGSSNIFMTFYEFWMEA